MKKMGTRKVLRGLGITVGMLLVSAMGAVVIAPEKAVAASYSDCVSSSGAGSVDSIKAACNNCFASGTTSRQGALWFNDKSSASDKNSDLIVLSYKNKKPPKTKTFYLWGQVYGCRHTGVGPVYARSIAFYYAGTTEKVDFLTLNSGSTTMYRGQSHGQWKWSTGGNRVTGKLDINKFLSNSHVKCSEKEEITGVGTFGDATTDVTEIKTTQMTCTAKVDVYRCFSSRSDKTTGYCGSDPSDLKVKVIEQEEIPKEDDPPDTPEPVSEFWSTSTVHIPEQNDVSEHIVQSAKDSYAGITVSTDAETTKVEFSHDIHYASPDTSGFQKEDAASGVVGDYLQSVETDWEILDAENKPVAGGGSYSVPGGRSTNEKSTWYNQSEIDYSKQVVNVTLEPGETKTVCRRFHYEPKNITFSMQEDYDGSNPNYGSYGLDKPYEGWYHDYQHLYYDYGPSSDDGYSGEGQSSACATITRPKNPVTVTEFGAPVSAGDTGAGVMYAGETTNMSWNVQAKGVNVRRLVDAQPVVFTYPVERSYSPVLTGGAARYKDGDTCDYFGGGERGASDCVVLDDAELKKISKLGYMATSSINQPRTMAVMDDVGWKYCNSYGYQFEYWYAVSHVEGSVGSWKHEDEKDYWYIFGGSCRTIAKKPSTAVWNGNYMSAGGIKTSLSPRFEGAAIGWVNPSGARPLYGSWAEFLAASGNTITGFGSGASLSTGSTRSSAICDSSIGSSNSPLTIANTACSLLGHSGIGNNSTVDARLNTYLRRLSSGSELANLGTNEAGRIKVDKTAVIVHSGDLTIDKNIEIPSEHEYDSIYDLPQAIIFVDDGDVKIASNVTRIDAWIITTGKVNTCSEFSAGVTAARARTSIGTEYVAANSYCQNQLVFNGPVRASKVILNRSYGSDPEFGSTKASPGEVFNLRADAYLWALAQSTRYDSSYTEAYSRELAPRY